MEFVLWKVEGNHNRISSQADSFCLIKDKKKKSTCGAEQMIVRASLLKMSILTKEKQESLRHPNAPTLTFCCTSSRSILAGSFFFFFCGNLFVFMIQSCDSSGHFITFFDRVSLPASSAETLETLLVLRHLNMQPGWTTRAENSLCWTQESRPIHPPGAVWKKSVLLAPPINYSQWRTSLCSKTKTPAMLTRFIACQTSSVQETR